MESQAKTNKRYVLLDRDGTIILNMHYQKNPAITQLLPNAREGLEKLLDAGFGLVMVTNQSGVGRGLMKKEDAEAVNESVSTKLGEGRKWFDAVYYCPHVEEDGCDCRKPLPGMALQAAKELSFSLGDAFVVGDREADINLGKAIGSRTVLVRTDDGAKTEKAGKCSPDYVADDLLDAAEWILAQ